MNQLISSVLPFYCNSSHFSRALIEQMKCDVNMISLILGRFISNNLEQHKHYTQVDKLPASRMMHACMLVIVLRKTNVEGGPFVEAH